METPVFDSLLQQRGLSLSKRQKEQFALYYTLLVEWNDKVNLTAITEREQVYEKHFYDSLALSFFFPLEQTGKMVDIGAGAGFPSLPLKIMFPHLQVTIIDSLNKRISFLNMLVAELGLSDVAAIHARAEDAGRDGSLRDRFDLATARAVARLPVLNEFCLPFVKPNGFFVAMKGSEQEEEVVESSKSLKELRAELVKVDPFVLPLEQSRRHFITIRKIGSTPAKYPRKAGLPLKQPLV